MKRWWLSWYSAGPFTLNSPWWISGRVYDEDGKGQAIFCAAVEANTEAEAKAIVGRAHDDVPEEIRWRFCNERPSDWSPFCDRFQRATWMKWPVRA